MASVTALLRAPFCPPSKTATLTLNSFSTSSGMITSSLPMLASFHHSVNVSLHLYITSYTFVLLCNCAYYLIVGWIHI